MVGENIKLNTVRPKDRAKTNDIPGAEGIKHNAYRLQGRREKRK